MRKLILFVLAIFFLSTGAANAAEADTAASTPAPSPQVAKIGVVDMQIVATESDPAKAAREEMESKYGKEREGLEKKGQSLKKQAEALKNPKASEQKKLDFIKAKQKLDQDTRNFLRKVEQDEVKIRQDMVTLVFNATYEVARAKGYNFVVDVNAGGVLYADRSMDLTQAVLEEVNRLYKENKNKKPAENKAAPAQKPAAK